VGQRIREAGNEESAVAGRAILMLIEEVERLRLEQLRVREQLSHLAGWRAPKPTRRWASASR
jgi:hypothetical protein